MPPEVGVEGGLVGAVRGTHAARISSLSAGRGQVFPGGGLAASSCQGADRPFQLRTGTLRPRMARWASSSRRASFDVRASYS